MLSRLLKAFAPGQPEPADAGRNLMEQSPNFFQEDESEQLQKVCEQKEFEEKQELTAEEEAEEAKLIRGWMESPPSLEKEKKPESNSQPATDGFFDSLKDICDRFKKDLAAGLEGMLDEKAWESIPLRMEEESKKSPTDINTPEPEEDPLFYYANLMLLSEQLCECLPVLREFVTRAGKITSQQGSFKIAREFFSQASGNIARLPILDELVFQKLLPTLARIKLERFPIRLPVTEDILKVASFLFPLAELKGEAARNPFFEAFTHHPDAFRKLLKMPSQSAEQPAAGISGPPPPGVLLLTLPNYEAAQAVPAENPPNPPSPALIADMQCWAESLQEALNAAAGDEIPKEAQDALDRTGNALRDLLAQISKFSAGSKGILETLRFALSIRKSVMDILKHGFLACSSLGAAFRERFLQSVQQLNLAFRMISLHLDQIECKLMFREGFFQQYPFFEIDKKPVSCAALFEEFNRWVEKNGYCFLPAETFPWSQSVCKQRKILLRARKNKISSLAGRCKKEKRVLANADLLKRSLEEMMKSEDCRGEPLALGNLKKNIHQHQEKHTQTSNAIAKLRPQAEILEVRLSGAAQQIADQKTEVEDPGSCGVDQLTVLLDAEIERLRHPGGWYPHADRIRLDLLNILRTYWADQGQRVHPEAACERLMQLDGDFYKNAPLLFQGKTREVMQTVREMGLSGQNSLYLVENAIEALLKKRSSQPVFFGLFCPLLEERIVALRHLRDLLSQPGYRIDHALTVMNMQLRGQNYLAILEKHEAGLLCALRKLDKKISDQAIGKIQLNYFRSPPDPVPTVVDHNRTQRLASRKQVLEEELTTWPGKLLACCSPKKNKIRLLNQLLQILKDHMDWPFQNALDDVARSANGRHFYLLQQGRTGHLIQELTLSEWKREEVVQKLEGEIDRLREQRVTPVCFFGLQAKTANIHHVVAMCKLREYYRASLDSTSLDSTSVDLFMVNELSDAEKKVMLARSGGLIDILRIWDTCHVQQPIPLLEVRGVRK